MLAEGSKGAAAVRTYDYQSASPEILSRVEALEQVCAEYGISLATAATQFVYAHPAVTAVVQGALSTRHVEGNVAAISEKIPYEFWSALKSKGLIPEAAPIIDRTSFNY